MKLNFNKENLKYIYVILTLIFLIFSVKIVTVFEFLYRLVGYGLMNEVFEYSLGTVYLLIGLIVTFKIFKFEKKEKKGLLPVKRVLILYLMTLIPILIISASFGWEVKIFFDIPDNSTGTSIINHFVNILLYLPKLMIVTLIIHFSQYLFEESVTFNKENIKRFIPFGGFVALLTFGLYELITGAHDLNILYLLFNIYFGFIYLATDKSIIKSFCLITLIFLL